MNVQATVSAVAAWSALADSAIKHCRGSFENRAMYTPVLVSPMTLASSALGVELACDRKPAPFSRPLSGEDREGTCGEAD
jgi:hypothetical protein